MAPSSYLMSACVDGDVQRATSSLDGGAPIDFQDGEGYTPLHLAVVWNHAAVVELLIRRDADPNIVNRHGNGPLWTAVFEAKGDDKVVTLLLLANADAFQTNSAGRSPIQIAQQIGHGLETPFAGVKSDVNRVNRPAYETVNQNCLDCDAEPNNFHEPFCLKERCPFCDGQLATCDCIIDVLDLNEQERTAVEEYVDDSAEPLKTICGRWFAALDEKGRIPWLSGPGHHGDTPNMGRHVARSLNRPFHPAIKIRATRTISGGQEKEYSVLPVACPRGSIRRVWHVLDVRRCHRRLFRG
jgi:hypothetical protein